MNNIKFKLSLVAAFIIVACGMVSLFNNVCSLYVSNILPEWKPKKTIVIDPGHGGCR
jgi:lipoprotein